MMFSIIIPIYNQEKYLGNCIESVICQTYNSYEIVLVDDGSKDKSAEICDYYSSEYSFISVLHQENMGLVQARINGFNMSKGEFILFLDSDDALRSDALETIHQCINNNADLVLYSASSTDDFKTPFKKYPFADKAVFSDKQKSILYEYICTSSLINEFALKAFKREYFNTDFLSEETKKVKNGEDCLFSLPIIDKAQTIVFLSSLLYFYRPNPNSMVHKSNPKCFESYRVVTEERIKYAEKWNNMCEGLLDRTYCFAGEQCYTAVRNVMTSNISWKEKVTEIKHIKGSDFYKQYHFLLPKGFSLMKRAFYLMWLTNNMIISNFATLVYRNIR